MVHAMQTARLKWARNEKGLTLIELLAVVVIIGIIAAIAIPLIIGGIERSKRNTDTTNEAMITEAAIRYMSEHDTTFTGNTATIDVDTHLVDGGYIKTPPARQLARAADTTSTPAVTAAAVGQIPDEVTFARTGPTANWTFSNISYRTP